MLNLTGPKNFYLKKLDLIKKCFETIVIISKYRMNLKKKGKIMTGMDYSYYYSPDCERQESFENLGDFRKKYCLSSLSRTPNFIIFSCQFDCFMNIKISFFSLMKMVCECGRKKRGCSVIYDSFQMDILLPFCFVKWVCWCYLCAFLTLTFVIMSSTKNNLQKLLFISFKIQNNKNEFFWVLMLENIAMEIQFSACLFSLRFE